MPKAKHIRIDLLEPLPATSPMATPDQAMEEFFDFLINEFENQGIAAKIQIVEENGDA